VTIDIMLPFYGDSDHLREAVASVLAQQDPDWRLSVVDDAYPDPSAAAWVADIADPRVHLIRNPSNLGVSGSFQRCLELATEDWVVIMGGDDRMLPDYVARVHESTAAHPDVAFFQPGVRVIDERGEPALPMADRIKSRLRIRVDRPTTIDPETMTASLMRGNWMYFPATAWRRELALRHGFEPRYEVVLDWLLMLQLLLDGHRVLLDPAVTFEYRRHAESVSSDAAFNISRFHEEKALVLGMVEVTRRRGWTRAARHAAWHSTSRLHAVITLGRRLLAGRVRGSGALVAHAFTNRRPPGDWPAPEL
jgi:glycosyltransferase involved in cell wall biosynthesis